jgi:DnaK suppressor protein
VEHAALTDAERRELRAQLEAEQERTTAQVAALVQTFDELVAAADLEPPDDEHDPDGTTAYERAQVTSLARESRARLDALAAAIALVDDAAYGACEGCGGSIGLERLQAVPGTRRCIACAAGAPSGG